MDNSPFLPLPDGLALGQVEIGEAQLTVEVTSTHPCACCPECGTLSEAVHCQYQRRVQDIPIAGRQHNPVIYNTRQLLCFIPVDKFAKFVMSPELDDLGDAFFGELE